MYTKGGWNRNIKPARKYSVIFAGRNTHVATVCSNSEMPDAEVEANCNLIAAAPYLLEALKNLLRDEKLDDWGQPLIDSRMAAQQAIAKAEGAV